MEFIVNPGRERWPELCQRNLPTDDSQLTDAVQSIISQVAAEGDKALVEMARRFDNLEVDDLRLSDDEIEQGVLSTPKEVRDAIDLAAANITRFHQAQIPQAIQVETVDGVICEQRPVPIRRVGLYIPGGRAPLFSTVLMLAIPARVAGCDEIVLCTPQNADTPVAAPILYAAKKCGVTAIYRVGGAQAIAAMAFGTESIPRVDKIFGPGNRFVTKAKQLVSSVVAIDMPAGPSEVMVLADDTADAVFVASDMLSQAEHGPDSQALLVTTDATVARQAIEEVDRQCAELSRGDLIGGSLSHSRVILFNDKAQVVDFANDYGAEHLIISMKDPWNIADHITAAGSIFIGNYSPESAGDYASGTNHTLPTGGWAKSHSGVNVDSFVRKITIQELTADGLRRLQPTITAMAMAEGLDAHAAAVNRRIDKLDNKSK